MCLGNLKNHPLLIPSARLLRAEICLPINTDTHTYTQAQTHTHAHTQAGVHKHTHRDTQAQTHTHVNRHTQDPHTPDNGTRISSLGQCSLPVEEASAVPPPTQTADPAPAPSPP